MTTAQADPAAILAPLIGLLLPGDELFPPAATLGLAGRVAERLAELGGPGTLDRLAAALPTPPDGAAVTRLERQQPALFELALKVVYLTYYEQPEVQAAIRALGFPYNATPLPTGYAVGGFDAECDLPRHGRGRFLATGEVRRVDLGGLDCLGGGPR
jgi:hypothetical protein